MKRTISLLYLITLAVNTAFAQQIPLPEHPRPDFERENWQNLNGIWAFEFDKNDEGEKAAWFNDTQAFTKNINVPFPWGSSLSGLKDEADYAWYQRTINVPTSWKNKRVFLTIGASDWKTTVWLDGQLLGSHEGGYTPFSFELTNLKYDSNQNLVIKVDDKRRDFTLYGKQGYGNARGIWQTVYLEAREQYYVDALHFTPNIDNNSVRVTAHLPSETSKNLDFSVSILGNEQAIRVQQVFPKGKKEYSFDILIPNARKWTLEDPFLYQVSVKLDDDELKSYFGMRKISTMNLPNTHYKYVALNNKPVYLQLALDQSYHPDGFYTFPTDEFMKNEILIARNIGLNGIRTHIKVEIPRKLYWADKLGVLVMADLPNFWGEPTENARKESESTLREMIKRDYNHPAIFSWITFNETWGLRTKQEISGKPQNVYLPETQKWVASVYRLAKSLDTTRLVEDNSICCGAGHTETDLNSWHDYLPGWEWEKHLSEIDKKTFVGSDFHYEKGYLQTDVPNINSECGNVWGYDGSTGDVDWSYDYHRMMNTFRKYPKIAGWLYTEHHDVINEWNGYVRFDRSEKETGLSEIVEGMSVKDFHSDIYISNGNEICRTIKETDPRFINLPFYISSMTDRKYGNELVLKTRTTFIDRIGQKKELYSGQKLIPYFPYINKELEDLVVEVPQEKGLMTVEMILEDITGIILHRNFSHLVIEGKNNVDIILQNGKKAQILSTEATDFKDAKWSLKQWNVLNAKANGTGSGYFEYRFKIPADLDLSKTESISFVAEASAKQLFAKDMDKKIEGNPDYMLGSKVESSQNPNAYPMTDQSKFPTSVSVSANGYFLKRCDLPDDPADHRGVLSWHNQLQDRKLREAGSYGYRLSANLSQEAIEQAKKTGEISIRLEVSEAMAGGLAIYGDRFGRYPMNPSLVFVQK